MAKVNIEIVGKDKASGTIKGITSSLISSQLAVEGIKIATKALIDIGKKSIESYQLQEQVLSKLRVQTNGNTESIEKWTSEIQKATVIGDENAQAIASLGLSMGIAEDKLEGATKGAIGLSEAFGIDLNTSMKMVAQAGENNYNMLGRYIPSLKTATTEAEKQAIVNQAMANGYELAQAKANTFTGKMEQLKNVQGDTLEAFGQIISVVGKDFVDGMIKAQQAVNDFLNNSDNIAKIGASFEVVKTIFAELGGTIFEEVKNQFANIKKELSELLPKGDAAELTFTALAVASKLAGMAFTIVIKALGIAITYFINMMKVTKEAIQVLTSFWDAVTGKKQWSDVWESIKDVGNAYKDTFKDVFNGAKDLVTSTIDEFKTFNTDVKNSADKYKKTWQDTNQKIKEDFKNANKEIIDKNKNTGDVLNKDTNEDLGKQKVTWKDYYEAIKQITSEFYGIMMEARDGYYETTFAKLESDQERQLESVNDWAEKEMEAQGVRLQTKQEQLQEEIDALNEKLSNEKNIKDQAAIQEEIRTKESELKRENILAEAERKRDKIQKDAKKKETALKKKQLEENRAFSIAQIWINAAQAVIGWWAAFAAMGIPGIVLAGVMTAATLAMAGVQTGIVASQTFHGQEGGEIPNGTSSGDRSVTYMNKGEALLKSDDYKALVGMAKGNSGGNIYISNMTVMANNPDEFADQMNEVRRYEVNR